MIKIPTERKIKLRRAYYYTANALMLVFPFAFLTAGQIRLDWFFYLIGISIFGFSFYFFVPKCLLFNEEEKALGHENLEKNQ